MDSKSHYTYRVFSRSPASLAPLLLALCFLAVADSARAQISPGPLSRAHHSLDGPTHCGTCHKLAAGPRQLQCLECHNEIAQRISVRRGFHASVAKPGTSSRDCVACHSEHNGEDFELVHWEGRQKAFDHNKTGYMLEGKHAGIPCQQCHNAKHISDFERAGLKTKDLNRTFLGLSRECASCHVDQHRGQLGKDCQRCHNFNDWKKTSPFDHFKTRFPLTGAHAGVQCQKCHKPETTNAGLVKYVGLAFSKCADCHDDPHRGAFNAACESCHDTAGWKHMSFAAVSTRFDHSRTKYPLLGKHGEVRCDACHAGGEFNKPVAHERCGDCHRPDPHGGQFAARKDGGECGACHTVEGFKPARFGTKEHAATAYPLEARHASIPCEKCHIPAGKETRYRIKFAQCTDCHRDIHQGQFAGTSDGHRCESCHTLRGFRPSTFTLARHNSTRFPLNGGHVAVACMDCHEAKKSSNPSAAAPYRFKDLSCTECHLDPHKGQFAERMQEVLLDGGALGCAVCHSTKTWNDTARFDHSTTKFVLTGTHRAVGCINCHQPANLELTMKNVLFKSAPKDCEGCHQDPHARQFARDGKEPRCADCHNTNKWRPSLFDHETQAAFSLKGAHQNVRCNDCHKTTRVVEEKTVLVYQPTPKACAACHGPNPPKAHAAITSTPIFWDDRPV